MALPSSATAELIPSPPWSASQATTGQNSSENETSEPGEGGKPLTAQKASGELVKPDTRGTPNPFAKYQPFSNMQNVSNNQSSLFRPFNGTADKGCVFGQPSLSPSVVNPFAPVRQPTTSVRGRNHARLGEIVQSLENINGSVSELLSIACIQEQLDTAFDDLERAKGQLKEVIHQFQAKGYMSNQQTRKKNCATDDLGKASRRIIALFQQLSAIQRQTPGSG